MAGCASCLHKNVHPNVCSDCLGGTHYKPRKPRNKTNADRIRAMSDEELAKACNDYFGACPPVDCPDSNCEACWLDWLKIPEEEGEGWKT